MATNNFEKLKESFPTRRELVFEETIVINQKNVYN